MIDRVIMAFMIRDSVIDAISILVFDNQCTPQVTAQNLLRPSKLSECCAFINSEPFIIKASLNKVHFCFIFVPIVL
jgi:hypothetical protein